jgi:hypothetical protein
MKTLLLRHQVESSRRSNTIHARRSPLPAQGEGEGEGLPAATRTAFFETPHLSPLPFSKGRGEKKRALVSATLDCQNMERHRLGYRICQSTNSGE